LQDIRSNAFSVLVEYFTAAITMQEFNVIKEEINFSVLALLVEEGVELAGASTDVRVVTDLNTVSRPSSS
jgi:hypothetical protein